MTLSDFQKSVAEGIPWLLPGIKHYDQNINHAPKRKDILTKEEKKLAFKNALRYFDKKHHRCLLLNF